jgi:hypothetical protein
MADPNTIANDLFGAQPDPGNNPVGVAMRSALVSRLKGATPGSQSGSAYRAIFFSGYGADSYEGAIDTAAPSLDGNWWSGFASAGLCQVMLNVTSNLKGQLLGDKINGDVASYNATLKGQLLAIYGLVMQTGTACTGVSDQFKKIGNGQAPQVAQAYKSFIESPVWISKMVGQAASRSWHNPAWDLFHHWLKLRQLGVSAGDLTTIINTVASRFASGHYTIPSTVTSANWQSYSPLMNPGTIDWTDLQGASNAALRTECHHSPGARGPSCMAEQNSYNFTANGQPGSSYRSAPSSSCFFAGTRILMADRTTKAIELVEVGEQVLTRSGGAEVLATAVLRNPRKTAYGLNGGKLRFTGTHPFVTAGEGAALACAEPLRTLREVPTLSAAGLAGLGADGPALLRFVDGAAQRYPIRSLDIHDDQPADALIYDLVTEFDEHGASEYIAGDGETMLVVSSELPRYGEAPLGTYIVSDVIEAAWPSVRATLDALPADRRLDAIHAGIEVVATDLLADSVRAVAGEAKGKLLAAPPERADRAYLAAHARTMAGTFMSSSPNGGSTAYDREKGAFFGRLVATIGHEFDDAARLGWRSFAPSRDANPALSLSVCTLALADAAHVPPQDGLCLQITLAAGGTAATRATVPVQSTRDGAGHYRFSQLAAFEPWHAAAAGADGPDGWLSFKACRADGVPLPLSATMPLPPDLHHGYRRFSASVLDAQGQHVGELTYDLRLLDRAEAESEAGAAARWTAADAHAFAHALGRRAGALMAERFADAVQFGLSKFGGANG